MNGTCAVGTFDSTFGLGAIGTDDVNVEILKRTAKLGQTRTGFRIGFINSKDGVLVTVKGHRLAIGFQVALSGLKIVECSFAGAKAQFHKLTGGIINEHQQRAFSAAVFKPIMIGAINLD